MTNPQQSQPLKPEEARSNLASEASGHMPFLPMQFVPVEDLTTFRAQWANSTGDLIFHFFVTDEVNARTTPSPQEYWLKLFPEALEKTLREYFRVEPPRIVAAYTEEQASWWVRAKGFGYKLDPHRFVNGYLERLDAELDRMIGLATSSK